MATISITPENVSFTGFTTVANLLRAKAGEDINAGELVYKAADDLLYKAVQNDTEIKSQVFGISLGSPLAGQRCNFTNNGIVNVGAVLTTGGVYVLSATAGKMADKADISSGFLTNIGVALSTTQIRIRISLPIDLS